MSAVVGDITVNLRTGTATGLAGVANIRNVVGSDGDDVLVGTGGNTLTGGAGRDLLVAGASPSALFGGSGDDLLIAGTTTYDTDQAALDAVRAVWVGDGDYDTRVSALRAGWLGRPGAVTANGGANQLSGGLDRDYFFASVLDLTVGEVGERIEII
jgi:hypothetical protein